MKLRRHAWLAMAFVFLIAGCIDAVALRAHHAAIELGMAWVMRELSEWRKV